MDERCSAARASSPTSLSFEGLDVSINYSSWSHTCSRFLGEIAYRIFNSYQRLLHEDPVQLPDGTSCEPEFDYHMQLVLTKSDFAWMESRARLDLTALLAKARLRRCGLAFRGRPCLQNFPLERVGGLGLRSLNKYRASVTSEVLVRCVVENSASGKALINGSKGNKQKKEDFDFGSSPRGAYDDT